MKKVFVFFFIFLLILPAVLSIGIGPPRITVDFKPNLEESFEFVIVNTISEEVEVSFYTKGDLTQYVTLSEEKMSLAPGKQGKLIASLKLPASVDKPGLNEIRIGALESLGSSSGTVGAKAGVEAQLQVMVPYAGKYLEAELLVPDIKTGEKVKATIKFNNLGEEAINELMTDLSIFDSSGKKVASMTGEKVALEAKETKEINLELPEILDAGVYQAKAQINYDGKTKLIEKEFKIGEMTVEILDLVEDRLKVGDIIKLEFNVLNKWNAPLEAKAKINIYQNNELVDSLESKSYTLEPWKTTPMGAFWEAKEVSPGEYELEIILNYEDKTATKKMNLELVKSSNWWLIGLIVAGALVILLIIGWLVWRKKEQSESSPQ